jgi:aminoglycoside phosphotransferase
MEATATTTNLSAPLVAASPLASAPDCDRVNIVLDQLLDGRTLTEEDEDYLVHHGDDCSPCFDDIKKQQFFIGFLNQKVSRHRAPSALPHAIMARLQAEMA